VPSRHSDNSAPVEAGVYCRMSLVAMNDPTKVEDQARISRELAASLGWKVASGSGHPEPDGVYTDNNRSAWKRNRKRPAWDQMLADVEAGKINAIVVYHGDRLMRQPRDLENLIELAEGKGIRLAAPTGMRNLDNTDDRFVLRILVAQACMESDNTSRRRKAQYDRWALEGRVRPGGPGGRSFGFESDNLTPVEAEFELVREAAERVLAGESPYAVARDWNARGLTPTTGKPWRSGNLGPMLALPRYAGLMPDGETKAAWPAALDRETWERVRLVLEAKASAYTGHTNARRWLLSGIALCGACGEPLAARYARRNVAKGMEAAAVYGCASPGCRKVQRSAAHLDAYVGAMTVARLANPLNPEGQAVPVDRAAEWAVLQRERADTEAELADYRRSAGRSRALNQRLDGIDRRMAELRELAAGDSRTRLLERYAGITREEWDDDDLTPLSVRRALVAACFTVTVQPASKRGPGFRAEDVQVEPAG
jgi:site-specific DNA recombinase